VPHSSNLNLYEHHHHKITSLVLPPPPTQSSMKKLSPSATSFSGSPPISPPFSTAYLRHLLPHSGLWHPSRLILTPRVRSPVSNDAWHIFYRVHVRPQALPSSLISSPLTATTTVMTLTTDAHHVPTYYITTPTLRVNGSRVFKKKICSLTSYLNYRSVVRTCSLCTCIFLVNNVVNK
jgi:hypothetical protein